MTKEYIAKVKELETETPKYWYQNPNVFIGVIGVLVLGVYIAIEIYRHV